MNRTLRGLFLTMLLLGAIQQWWGGSASPDTVGLAYIGPGAGFAFLGSFLTLIAGFLLSMV